MESTLKGHIYKTMSSLKAQGSLCKRGRKDCRETEDQGACYKTVSPTNIRSYTKKMSQHDCLKQGLNKDKMALLNTLKLAEDS